MRAELVQLEKPDVILRLSHYEAEKLRQIVASYSTIKNSAGTNKDHVIVADAVWLALNGVAT